MGVDAAITVRQEPPERAGLRVARRAQAGRRAGRVRRACRSPAGAAWTRAPRPAASPTCCWAPGRPHVVAVDVGYGQLAWSLRTDPRVTVLDRVNVRALQPEQVAPPPGLVTADLSFISLTLVLPALVPARRRTPTSCSWSSRSSRSARARSARAAWSAIPALRAGGGGRRWRRRRPWPGPGVAGVTASPLPGPSGNVEYFLWLRRGRAAAGRRRRCARPSRRARSEPAHADDAAGGAHRPGRRRGAPGGRSRPRLLGRRGRACGCWSPRRPSSAARGATVVPASPAAAAGAEMVVVIGGDGTLLRAAELARRRRRPAAGRQPGPRRLPGRGRAGGPVRRRRPGVAGEYSVEERMTVDVDRPDQRRGAGAAPGR